MADQEDVQALLRRLKEAERLAEEERRGREEADRRAKEERRHRREADRRAEEARERLRPTTLDEYLNACHNLVFSQLKVETDRRLTTKGSITSPRKKYCPTHLVRWKDFLNLQCRVQGDLLKLLAPLETGTFESTEPLQGPETRAFESTESLQGQGVRVARKPLAGERDLEYFLASSITHPVESIVEHLVSVPTVKQALNLGKGIVFENNLNDLNETAEEVQDRHAAAPPPPPSTPKPKPKPTSVDGTQLRADQICVWWEKGEGSETQRVMLYITEYKAPHKITLEQLRAGLHEMNIIETVVNRATIPTDPTAKFEYNSERLVASALTQTFHYMIEGGLEYGVMTTGEAIVFLKLDWSKPDRLEYHLAEPAAEVKVRGDESERPYCTAVAQMLTFTLMALNPLEGRRQHSQDKRQATKKSLNTWDEDWEEILRSMSPDERKAPPSSPPYEPETYRGVDRKPRSDPVRTRSKALGGPAGLAPSGLAPDSSDSSDDEESTGPSLATPTPAGGGRNQGENRGGQTKRRLGGPRSSGGAAGGSSDAAGDSSDVTGDSSDADGEQIGPYCTQRCLLGLAGQGRLDERCPNVALHRRQGDGVHHPVNGDAFLALLHQQLERTLDDGIEPLGYGGARGVLFRVALLAHGYVFVAKGTVPEFIEDLEHEVAVYTRLQPVQGQYVPVCLGAVDLRAFGRTYYYDLRVYIRYMTFLSWGGEDLDAAANPESHGDLHRLLLHSLRALHACGVVHRDIRAPNVLFCKETQGVMIIDFERSLLVDSPRCPLASTTPNKRKRPVADSGAAGKTVSRDYAAMGPWLMRWDVGAAETIIEELGTRSSV